ncbi:pirin family protein [Nibrella saemangeumensis]
MERQLTMSRDVALTRKLVSIQTPAPQPGFLGPGHTARPVIQVSYSDSDPFIMLMDDWLDKKSDEPVGGSHPHAGFETVSLLLEGEIGGSPHRMKAGDFQLMTAGSGIIHTETIDTKTHMRLLQLWLTLPEKDRWATPRVQDLPIEHVPTLTENGITIRLYSGKFAGLISPVQNYVPLIIADIQLQPGINITQQLPASFTAFLYIIEGSVAVGEEQKVLQQHQVGWLNRFSDDGPSDLELTAGKDGGRLVLYAGQPQHDPIVSHGPFIGDTPDDIKRLYQEFRQGKMKHVSTLPDALQIRY